MALPAPAAHQPQLRIGLCRGVQGRDIGRIVLAVAVQRGNPRRACRQYAGQQGRTLAQVGGVAQHAQARLVSLQAGQPLRGGVAAAVVDEQDFIVQPVQRGADLVEQRLHIVLLVENRDNQGKIHKIQGVSAAPACTARCQLCIVD